MNDREPNRMLPWLLLLAAIVVLAAVYLLRDRGPGSVDMHDERATTLKDTEEVEKMLDEPLPAPLQTPGEPATPAATSAATPEATPASEPIADEP